MSGVPRRDSIRTPLGDEIAAGLPKGCSRPFFRVKLVPKLEWLFLILMLLAGAGCNKSDSDPGTAASPAKAAERLDQSFADAPAELRRIAATASEALRTESFEKAVVLLQAAKGAEGLTMDQGIAVHSSFVALEQRLLSAAAGGDPEAQKAYNLLKASKRN